MIELRSYRDLEVWKQSIDWVERIYQASSSLPPAEKFGLTSQLRRAAVSVPANIAEGAERSSRDGPPKVSARRGIQALQFLQDDEKQLVQVRVQGFSFNRLAPYSTLDDYLPEIERTWRLFVNLASPIQIRVVRLRYINRVLLPLTAGRVDLSTYLEVSPQLPPEAGLTFAGFLNQQRAVEKDTGNEVNIVITSQLPENDALPIILDISVARAAAAKPEDWAWILSRVQSLRALKNRVFLEHPDGRMLEAVSLKFLVGGYAALNLMTRPRSAISTEAQAVRKAAIEVVDFAQRSQALFGAKVVAISQIYALV